jgi:cyanophycinase-like exopeptidase
VTGLLALIGGQEHQRGCEPIDQRLLGESGTARAEVTVLLAATPPHRRAFKIAEATGYWKRLGARARVAFTGRPDDIEHALALLEQPDLVVLTGGRPWLLQARLAATPLRERLKALWRSGVPISASSAGAMALAEWRWALQPSAPLMVVPGLSFLTGTLFAPHVDRHGIRWWAGLTRRRNPYLNVLGMQDRSAIVGRRGEWRVMGAGSALMMAGGGRRWYRPGEPVLVPAGSQPDAHPRWRVRRAGVRSPAC